PEWASGRAMVTRRDQRGVALIFVLWLLVLLGVIIAEVASRARAEAALLTSLRSRTVARYAAESGILAATVAIERLVDSSYNPLERASLFRQLDARLASLKDVELGGARFGVAALAPGIVARREGGEVFATLDPVHPPSMPGVVAAAPLVSTVPSRLMLVSRGWQEGRPLTHEIQAVFAIVGRRLVLQSSWER